MRILMLTHHVSWRSRLARSTNWGRFLARKGHSVTIVEISENNHFKFDVSTQDGLTYIGSPDMFTGKARSGWDAWDVFRRILYVLPKRFDIVHSIDSRPVTVLPALICKYFRNAKLILDWGDWWGRGGTIEGRSTSVLETWFAPIETFFEEAFRRYADGTIVLSSALKERAIALGVNPKTILLTTTGADVEHVQPINKSVARKLLNLELDKKIIGYVGIIYKEDLELLTQSFLHISRMDPTIQLMLIGRKSPESLNLPSEVLKKVIFIGDVSSEGLHKHIAACDAMILPLKNNILNRGRSPAKIGDYLAAGKPIIATRVEDICSMIEDGKCGVLTNDTPEDFAQETVELLSKPEMIDELGKNARTLALTKYDWRLLTARIEDFYYNLCAR